MTAVISSGQQNNIIFSSDGSTADYQGDCLGEFQLLDGQYFGSQVYQQVDSVTTTNSLFLYKQGDYWEMNDSIGCEGGYLRALGSSQNQVPQTGWEFWDYEDKRWILDRSLVVIAGVIDPVEIIEISGEGEVAELYADCFGYYHRTDQISAGRPVYKFLSGKEWYISILEGSSSWAVRDNIHNIDVFIKSAKSSLCPTSASASSSKRWNLENWRYKNNGWKEGKISVQQVKINS